MMTSKAVLFVKQSCAPCQLVKEHMNSVLEKKPGYGRHISVMKESKYPVLVEEYNVDLFPTLLIIDPEGEEMGRIVGGRNIAMDIRGVLFALYTINE